ncbi:MAG TPA: complex I NDUFA9 subunit family protein [Candidatus Binatia bacterium]|jgi:uncharacterized protein YbjT (DUF2867 family)|nr:complex I NDUFA9 subunit family protein [Candidatus Binatia bacterium]
MRVFLTGGTGFVGREIVRRLHGEEHSIRLLARRKDSRPVQEMVAQFGAEVRAGDVLEPKSLQGALNGCDAVIHLVGIISEVGRSTFENVHAQGTRNVVAASQAAGLKRFIQMSALGTRPAAVSRYHQSKWVAEEAVRGSGLDYTIFRPSLIYGPEDQFVNLFAKIIRYSPAVPVLGNREARFAPVPVQNVAKAFVGALSEPRVIGQTCDLCGSESFTLLEIVDQILAVMGRKRLKVPVPLPLACFQAAFLEFLFPRLLGKAPPLNRDQLIMLEEGNVGDPQPAQQLFALEETPFREGLARYLA